MSEPFRRLGLFLTQAQCDELLALYQSSMGPVLGVSYRSTLLAAEAADRARADYHLWLDAYAQALGLPEPREDPDLGTCHYGLDFRTGEVLGMLEEDQ